MAKKRISQDPDAGWLAGIISDTHYHPFARFSTRTAEGLNSWVDEWLSVFRETVKYCMEHNVRELWHLGDVFHYGARLSTPTFNAVRRAYRKANQWLPVRLVVGNHDLAAMRGDHHILESFKDVVTEVIDEPYDTWREPMAGSTVAVAFIPWRDDINEVRQHFVALKKLKAGAVDDATVYVLLGHMAIYGASAGRAEYVPQTPIKMTEVDFADTVLLGHYHTAQALNDKVIYVGSLHAKDFNDAGEEKGLTLLDHSGATQFVPFDSTGFAVLDWRAGERRVSARAIRDSIVRVDYDGPLDEEEMRTHLEASGAKVVTFKNFTRHEAQARVQSATGEQEPTLDEYLKAYVKTNGEGYDRKKLLKAGKDLAKV